MKKYIFAICIVFVVFFFFLFHSNGNDVREDYFYHVNELVRDIDFSVGRIESNKIILFDSQGCIIDDISFENAKDNVNITYIRKSGNTVYIVINAAVDDEQGIMFINGDENRLLDGIKSIERIGGNSYQYSTVP